LGVVSLLEASSLETLLGLQHDCSTVYDDLNCDRQLHSRRGDRLLVEVLGLSLGDLQQTTKVGVAWERLVQWDNVGTTTLAATTTGDDLDYSGTWRGAQRHWFLCAVHHRMMAQVTFLDPLTWRHWQCARAKQQGDVDMRR
jgi:hypothetical protein